MNRPSAVCEPNGRDLDRPCQLRPGWNPNSEEPLVESRPPWRRKLRWAVVGMLIVLPIAGALLGVKMLQFKTMAAALAKQVVPPQPVNAIEVREEQWQPRIRAVGSVTPVQGTIVSTEAEGVVRAINFAAGSIVPAGQELVQLDVEIEQAQLRAAEAAAELARLSFQRANGLIGSRSISQADVDLANSNMKQAEAQVDNIRAVIAKKTLRAPFAGKLGIRQISVGQFLPKGSPVVSLQSLDPVHVEFSLPQQRLGETSEGLTVLVTSDAYPGRVFEGQITAVNPEVDSATRNVRVQATLGNGDGLLRPGMFVSTEMIAARSEKVLLIPGTAVLNAPFGNSVFVIGDAAGGTNSAPGLVAQQRMVRLGGRVGDFVVVTDGVKLGEQIVSTGVFKLRPGMPVTVDNTLAPTFALAPKPKNN